MITASSSGRGVSRTPSNTIRTRVRQPVRLLLVDPLPVIHRALKSTLAARPDITIVGSSFDHSESASLAARLLPDIIILDLVARGRRSGTLHVRVDVLRKIQRRAPKSRCIVFTSLHTKAVVEMALAEHVGGIFSKLDNIDILPAVILHVHDNREETFLSSTVQRINRQRRDESDVSVLARITEREMEILGLVLRGNDTATIAKILGISPRTVGTHRSRILHKTKARSFFELAGSVRQLRVLGT